MTEPKFTDDDLQILKANRQYWEARTQSEPNHLLGLIARLEAAEGVAEYFSRLIEMGLMPDEVRLQTLTVWRKAAGK